MNKRIALFSGVRACVVALGLLVVSACASDSPEMPGQPKPDWSLADMTSQDGRIFLVTGGTSGIGYETAKALALAGADVVIAARSAQRGAETIKKIRQEAPEARIRFESFDLADLDSVRALSDRLKASVPHLDGLINNAGVMGLPERGTSVEGYEMHFAVNYLGHFALTAELLPLLQKVDAPRVVTLSSIAARQRDAAIHFSDLQFADRYDPNLAYRQSKLACLMFALELQRRSDAEGWGIQSMATHPGVSRTNLQVNNGFIRRNVMRFVLQPAAQGALSTLYAATDPSALGGHYYGPTGIWELRGPLGFAEVPETALDARAVALLWSVSERIGGSRYPSAFSE